MKETDNDINDMQKLAETGWKQMHQMLHDKGLSAEPAALSIGSKKRNLWMAIAALVCFMLIVSYPHLLKDHVSFSSVSKIRSENVATEKNKKQPLLQDEIKLEKNETAPVSFQPQLLHAKLNQQLSQLKKKNEVDLLQRRKVYLLQKFSEENSLSISIPTPVSLIENNVKIAKAKSVTSQKKAEKVAKRIQVFAGAGLNLSMGNNGNNSFNFSNLNVHPGITVVLPLSGKLSLHSGLWAFSTIHGKEVITKEKELVNNFAGNVYYNINTTSIIKASYFDVPVMLHYSISKNWSVGSGLQFSKLYKVSIKEEKESFDYNNTLASASVSQYNRTPMAAADAFQKKVEIKKFEPRFVAEVNFEQNRFLFSAGYYYAPGKTITVQDGVNSKHEYRNEYFKLGVQYKINP